MYGVLLHRSMMGLALCLDLSGALPAAAFQAPLPRAGCRPAGGVSMALEKVEQLPPTLSAPVFSLATLNDDGSTNMNILTYAVPVGIRPTRTWVLSLWQGTRSHENFAKRRRGVLQLLRRRHAPLVPILGKQSGATFDKETACRAAGFAWAPLLGADEERGASSSDLEESEGGHPGAQPLLLPNCSAYYCVSWPAGRSYQNAGEHDVAMCSLDGVYRAPGDLEIEAAREDDDTADIVLYTAWLRAEGIID